MFNALWSIGIWVSTWSSRYRAIESFTRDVEGLDGSAMVDLVAHRLEDSVGQRMLQLEQARS